MLGLRFLRVSTGAVVLGCAALAGTLVVTAPVSAATGTVTCTSLSGSVSAPTNPGVFTLGGCTGNTGGGGTAQGATISWANGRVTYLRTPAFSPSGTPRRGRCGALSGTWAVKDAVAGDTTGSIRVGGKVSAEVCIENEAPDPWSLAPRSVFRLR